MRAFELLPVGPGERIISPVADEILSMIARIDRLTEQVKGSGGGLPLLRELERAIDALEEQTRRYLGLLPDPAGEDPFAFRLAEDGTLVLVWIERS